MKKHQTNHIRTIALLTRRCEKAIDLCQRRKLQIEELRSSCDYWRNKYNTFTQLERLLKAFIKGCFEVDQNGSYRD